MLVCICDSCKNKCRDFRDFDKFGNLISYCGCCHGFNDKNRYRVIKRDSKMADDLSSIFSLCKNYKSA